jgi:hypothetical protein
MLNVPLRRFTLSYFRRPLQNWTNCAKQVQTKLLKVVKTQKQGRNQKRQQFT